MENIIQAFNEIKRMGFNPLFLLQNPTIPYFYICKSVKSKSFCLTILQV